MFTIREVIPPEEQLELAAFVFSPAHVATHFGQHCLQVPRVEFVALAHRVDAFYRHYSARNALRFRGRLDQILRDRGEPPIIWSEL